MDTTYDKFVSSEGTTVSRDAVGGSWQRVTVPLQDVQPLAEWLNMDPPIQKDDPVVVTAGLWRGEPGQVVHVVDTAVCKRAWVFLTRCGTDAVVLLENLERR